jgi:hypothetical protein
VYAASAACTMKTAKPVGSRKWGLLWTYEPYHVACLPFGRAINTGQWAVCSTRSDTLPSSTACISPQPRLPITMIPTPLSVAYRTISSDLSFSLIIWSD